MFHAVGVLSEGSEGWRSSPLTSGGERRAERRIFTHLKVSCIHTPTKPSCERGVVHVVFADHEKIKRAVALTIE